MVVSESPPMINFYATLDGFTPGIPYGVPAITLAQVTPHDSAAKVPPHDSASNGNEPPAQNTEFLYGYWTGPFEGHEYHATFRKDGTFGTHNTRFLSGDNGHFTYSPPYLLLQYPTGELRLRVDVCSLTKLELYIDEEHGSLTLTRITKAKSVIREADAPVVTPPAVATAAIPSFGPAADKPLCMLCKRVSASVDRECGLIDVVTATQREYVGTKTTTTTVRVPINRRNARILVCDACLKKEWHTMHSGSSGAWTALAVVLGIAAIGFGALAAAHGKPASVALCSLSVVGAAVAAWRSSVSASRARRPKITPQWIDKHLLDLVNLACAQRKYLADDQRATIQQSVDKDLTGWSLEQHSEYFF